MRRFGVDARDDRLQVRVNRLDLTTDALMGLLGATFGSGRLRATADEGVLELEFALGNEQLRLRAPALQHEPATLLEVEP